MKKFKSFAANHPVWFVLIATITWFVVELVLMGIAAGALHKPYGASVAVELSRLVTTAMVVLLIWRMGWLDSTGSARSGRWLVWLVALGGLVYYSGASLYSFYGKAAFTSSILGQSSSTLTVVLDHFTAGLSEEIMFRGVVLYSLTRVWGNTKKGLIASASLASLLFAVLHLSGVVTSGVSVSSALILTMETWIVSLWWGALVLWGKSIWPAVVLHFLGNAVVAVQGLALPMLEPDIQAYTRLLLLSIPLGVLGIWLLHRATLLRIVPEAP